MLIPILLFSYVPTFTKYVGRGNVEMVIKEKQWEVLFSAVRTPSVNTAQTNPGLRNINTDEWKIQYSALLNPFRNHFLWWLGLEAWKLLQTGYLNILNHRTFISVFCRGRRLISITKLLKTVAISIHPQPCCIKAGISRILTASTTPNSNKIQPVWQRLKRLLKMIFNISCRTQ